MRKESWMERDENREVFFLACYTCLFLPLCRGRRPGGGSIQLERTELGENEVKDTQGMGKGRRMYHVRGANESLQDKQHKERKRIDRLGTAGTRTYVRACLLTR